jgi:hypothetical protein
MTVNVKITVFWTVTLCSLVDGCLHFGGYQEDVGSRSLQNVGIYQYQ